MFPYIRHVEYLPASSARLRGSAKFKKIPKKLEVGGSRSHSDTTKLENRPKIQFCICTIRHCFAVHVAPQGVHACSIYPVLCDFVIVLRFG